MEKNRRTLRGFLIYPQFQVPLLALNAVALGLSLLVLWVTGEQTISELEPTAALSGMEIELYRRVLDYQSSRLRTTFLVAGLGALFFSTVVTFVLSHKIAGPLVALRNYFRSLRDGEKPEPLQFRDKDFLNDLPPLINEAMSTHPSHRQRAG